MKNGVNNINKVLIFEFWGIGDLVLLSGILGLFKKTFPQAEVTLLAKEHSKAVIVNNGSVDKIITYDFPWTKFKGKYRLWEWDWSGLVKLIKSLKAEKFDLILDARGDIRNNLISFLIGAKKRVGYDWTGGGYFLTDVIRSKRDNLHRVSAWVNLMKHIGIKSGDIKPVIHLSKEEESCAGNFLKSKGVDEKSLLVGIHPGARIKIRCWPLERFVNIARYLRHNNIQVVFFVEPQGYGEDAGLPDGCLKVKLDLRKYAAVVKRTDFLVCNDGGAMHVATAVGTPVIAVFGPTKKEWFGPYGDNNKVVIKENIACRPCFDYCKYREPYCLTGIAEEQVIQQIDGMINKIKKGKNAAITT